MRSGTGEDLLKRWEPTWRAMEKTYTRDLYKSPKFQGWLEDNYFHSELHSNSEIKDSFTQNDTIRSGKLIGKLLRFKPSNRELARDMLQDPWFGDGKRSLVTYTTTLPSINPSCVYLGNRSVD